MIKAKTKHTKRNMSSKKRRHVKHTKQKNIANVNTDEKKGLDTCSESGDDVDIDTDNQQKMMNSKDEKYESDAESESDNDPNFTRM